MCHIAWLTYILKCKYVIITHRLKTEEKNKSHNIPFMYIPPLSTHLSLNIWVASTSCFKRKQDSISSLVNDEPAKMSREGITDNS